MPGWSLRASRSSAIRPPRVQIERDEAGHCDRGIALALAVPYGLDIIEDIRRQWQIEEQMQYEPHRVYA